MGGNKAKDAKSSPSLIILTIISNSPCILLAFVLHILGFLFFFIGFVTINWNDFRDVERDKGNTDNYLSRMGLWKSCVFDSNKEICTGNAESGALHAVRFFEVINFILYIILFVLLILYLRNGISKDLFRATVLSFFTGLTCMISILTWVTQMDTIYQYNLSYSFTLTVLAFCLDMICVVLMNIELRSVIGQMQKVASSDRVDTQMSLV